MPRIISPAISIASYKYERRFQRMVDDLISYLKTMEIRLLFLLCICAFALSFTAMAQKPTPTPVPTPSPNDVVDDGDVVRVTSNLVVVPVSVLDKAGQPIKGLQIADFQLEENGRKQEITQIGDPDDVPLEIALLIDVSSSVDSRFEFEKQAASRFLKEILKPTDRATIFVVDKQPKQIQTLESVDKAIEKLLSVKPSKSYTAFYDTVTEAVRYLAKNTPSNHRRIIVVISDGDDTAKILETALSSNVDLFELTKEEVLKELKKAQEKALTKAQDETMKEVQKADASFYSINPSGDIMHLNARAARSQKSMEIIAEITGGTSFLPKTDTDLDAVFRQISAELRGQYLLQYYSGDESPEGKYIKIKVGVPNNSTVRVRSRSGYYKKQ